jgi:hypothetical protein
MSLLYDSDYAIIEDCGLEIEEDEANRFLIFKNFPLKVGLYAYNGESLTQAEILIVLPSNYNTSGNDMMWTHPELKRADGKEIPAAFGFGKGDARFHNEKEYCRWSRHFEDSSWRPKVDNVQKIIDRIEWALAKPDAKK